MNSPLSTHYHCTQSKTPAPHVLRREIVLTQSMRRTQPASQFFADGGVLLRTVSCAAPLNVDGPGHEN